MKNSFIILFLLSFAFSSCKKDKKQTTAYTLLQPYKFPVFENDVEKGITEEGIALGRRLFYDPILSGDGTMACATCHKQEDGFSDKRQFSIGIDGSVGKLQAMPIMNLVWNEDFFWNGRSKSLENQALEPVENPIEMKAHWNIVIDKLKDDKVYQEMFDDAFPEQEITKELAVDAIAQFEKTLISSNSKFDKLLIGEYAMTEQEQRGRALFFSEEADCFHCHTGNLMTDLSFHNNGLDANPKPGLAAVTNNENDKGKFKTPSLRNLAATAPYMHDGRFATLDEVLDFYSSGVQVSVTIDELMKQGTNGGVQLTEQEKEDLKAYLLLFNDPNFLTNPAFASPF
ncbi:MAG: cytochrome-c peroxidase [Chitinophagales bacterium]